MELTKAQGPGIGQVRLPGVLKTLRKFFQNSLNWEETLGEWRQFNISPIHKKGSKTDPKQSVAEFKRNLHRRQTTRRTNRI